MIMKQSAVVTNYSKTWKHMNMWVWAVNVCVVTFVQNSVTVVCAT